MIFPNRGKECIEISKIMKKLSKQPFEKMNCNNLKKGCIVSYELGELINFIVFDVVSHENGKKPYKTIYESRKKLAMMGIADLIIQLRFLCIEYGWEFDNIQKMGLEHRVERQKEILGIY